MLVLTDRALAEAHRLATEVESYRGRPLRVYIEGKGCDGFYYGVAFDEKIQADHVIEQGGLEVVIDSDSLIFLRNAVVDFVDDERGRGFLVENPDQRKFRGKFYKRQVWQDALAKKKAQPTSSSQ